jgi:hypothetical protein
MTPDQEREISRLLDSLEKQPEMDYGSMILVITVVALAGGVIGIFIRILIGE